MPILDDFNVMLRFRGLIIKQYPCYEFMKGYATIYPIVPMNDPECTEKNIYVIDSVQMSFPANIVAILIICKCTKSLGKGYVSTIFDLTTFFEHIIICSDGVSIHAKQAFVKLKTRIEFFDPIDVRLDILQSRLVPRYQILSECEILELESSYMVTRDKFPIMKSSDAIAKYLGFQVNDVVHALEYDIFRIVKL